MNWKRIGRAALCLLLVCCLIVNISPVRSKATGLGAAVSAAVASVPGLNVVAAVLIGLGVCAAVATTDWDTIANNCYVYLRNEGIVDEDGNIDIYAIDGVSYAYGVTQDLIETIRNWLFAEEVLTETVVPDGFAYYNGVLLSEFTCCFSSSDFVGIFYSPADDNYYSYHSSSSLGLVSDGRFIFGGSSISYHSYYYTGSSWASKDSGSGYSGVTVCGSDMSSAYNMSYIWSSLDVTKWDSASQSYVTVYSGSAPTTSSTVETSLDVSIGEVATTDTAIADGYATWAEIAVTIPGEDDDNIPVWPIGLNQTWEDTRSLTQADVWAGTGTYVDSTTDTETDTDTGVITGTFADTAVGTFINSLIDALMTPFEWLADTILAGIQAIFVPSEDFLTAKVNALRAEFGFVDSIMTTGQSIGAALTDFETTPPIIYMELSNAESQYDWGDRAIALDLRWYERYKPTVDTLLSALLWIFFAWRVFRKLPGIISGLEGDVPDAPVSDGRFILTGYASNTRRLGSGSLKRRE